MTITRCLIALFLLIHIIACLWIYLGKSNEKGWINRDSDLRNETEYYLDAYPSAIYFIVVTFTTVGYGDFLPNSNVEIVVVMVLELVGLAVFSLLIGVQSEIRNNETTEKIILRDMKNIQRFLNTIDHAMPHTDLPQEIFEGAHENLIINYKYGINKIIGMHDFFKQLKPTIKQELIVQVLHNAYVKFRNFFYCEPLNFSSKDRFIVRILYKLNPNVFLPGKVIIQKGESVEHLFFIEKGRVLVTNDFEDIANQDDTSVDESSVLAVLPRYSFFGDYQLFLN